MSQETKLSQEDIMLWADGTWCFRDELEEMTHMSDDYKVLLENSTEWEVFLLKEGFC
ncbi:SIR2 family NAD-dependent deacetylase [Bacteriophage Eos]|nr:SIR2 family NAD-dependent deacetylase [Bacteriophage Eos]